MDVLRLASKVLVASILACEAGSSLRLVSAGNSMGLRCSLGVAAPALIARCFGLDGVVLGFAPPRSALPRSLVSPTPADGTGPLAPAVHFSPLTLGFAAWLPPRLGASLPPREGRPPRLAAVGRGVLNIAEGT